MDKLLKFAWLFIILGWVCFIAYKVLLSVFNLTIIPVLIAMLVFYIVAIVILIANIVKFEKRKKQRELQFEQRLKEINTEFKRTRLEMENKSLKDKIEEMEQQLASLKKELEKESEPKKYEFWKPRIGETFYIPLCVEGFPEKIGYLEWDNVDETNEGYGNIRREAGIVYKTYEQAEYEANCIIYKHLYRRYIQEHTEPLDWGNYNQYKYYVYWDFDDKDFVINSILFGCKDAGVEYASSKQIIRDAIEFVGEDNFKKYVLELGATAHKILVVSEKE